MDFIALWLITSFVIFAKRYTGVEMVNDKFIIRTLSSGLYWAIGVVIGLFILGILLNAYQER